MKIAKWFTVVVLGLSIMDASAGNYEITPIFGHTSGGDFENSISGNKLKLDGAESFGLILGMKDQSREGAVYELLYMRQSTFLRSDEASFEEVSGIDVDVNYLHIGGTFSQATGRIQPFVSGGLGITYIDVDGGSSEVRPSLSIGAGLKIPITEHVSFRAEARGFGTFFNTSTGVYCGNGGCLVSIDGGMFWQFTAMAGVAISF